MVHVNIRRVAFNARRRGLHRLKKARRVERENNNAASNVVIASEIEAPSTVAFASTNVPRTAIPEAGRYDPTCNASKFNKETLMMCCRRFRLPCFRQLPEPLRELFRDANFMKDITPYNAAFSFTS